MDEDKVQPPQENKDAASEDQKTNDKPPVASVDIPEENTEESSGNPRTDKEKRKRKPLSCFEIGTLVLGTVGILVAAGTGFAIVWQDVIASSTLAELQRQYPQLEKSATAADSASHSAADAVQTSVRQFRQDERPYIWPYPVAGVNNVVLPPIGQAIYIRIDFKNSGRTPAIHVIPTHSITIVAPKMEARRQAREFIAKYPAIPGAVVPPELIGTAPTGYGPNLTDTILKDIKNGTWEIYVVGAVKYDDLFQPPTTSYETMYCFSFNPNGLPFGGCDWGGNSFK
jgi:hypothetical protein